MTESIDEPANGVKPALPDQAARSYALNPAASIIVQAPAGSGKTTLLATRYLRLLTTVNEPEEILAITFTKKAAAEMRHRILSLLGGTDALAEEVRQLDARHHWQLTENPQRLKIQTIDSFALELAGRSPLGGLSRGVRIEEDASPWYAQAAEQLLTKLYGNNPANPIIAEFFAFLDNDFDKASRLITSMLATRDQWLSTAMLVVSSNTEPGDALLQALERAVNALRDTAHAHLARRFTSADNANLDNIAYVLGIPLGLNEVLPHLLTKSLRLRKQLTVKDGIGDAQLRRELSVWLKDLHGRGLADDIESFCRLPHADAVRAHHDELNLVAYGLALAAAELDALFRSNGVLDFTGLLIYAKRALVDHGGVTELGLYLDYKIKHVLIDEFQDTSRSQIEFFAQLVEGWEVDDGRSFFVVGDPMQSIYRFRDADVAIFAECQRSGLGGVPLDQVLLQTNFRSSPVLIDWTNSLFAQLFGDADAVDLGQVPHSPALAVRDRQENDEVRCLEFANAAHEHHEVVSHVRALLKRNPKASIAVLCRARTHIAPLLTEFDRAGLHWQATDMAHLGARPVVTDLMSLYGVLLDPLESLHWLAVLRSPMFGLTLVELSSFTNSNLPLGEAIAESRDPRVQRFAQALSQAQRDLYEVTLGEVLETFWLRCGGLDAYPENEIPNAFGWFDLLDQLGSQAYQSAQVERGITSLFARSNASASAEGLQVMTIHKAKGLEFDHVIVPCLHRRARGDDPHLLRFRAGAHGLLMGVQNDPVHEWLKFEESQRSSNEEKRLLYVACTRAARSLWLSYTRETADTGKKSKPRPAGGLAGWLADVVQCVAPDTVLQRDKGFKTTADQVHAVSRQTDLFANSEHALLTGLPHDYVWQPADPPPLPRAPQMEREADPIAARLEVALGNTIHRGLAWLSNRWATTGDWEQAIKDVIHRLPLLIDDGSTVDRSQVLLLAEQQLQVCLSDPQLRWILQPRGFAAAEYPITIFDDGQFTRVVVDRLFVEEDEAWVIDYKTAQPLVTDDLATFVHAEVNRYRAQLLQYQDIVAQLLGKQVRTALYFTAVGHLEKVA